jgi:hypothetical protein
LAPIDTDTTVIEFQIKSGFVWKANIAPLTKYLSQVRSAPFQTKPTMTSSFTDRARSGRPRVTTQRQDRLATNITPRYRMVNARVLQRELQIAAGVNVSYATPNVPATRRADWPACSIPMARCLSFVLRERLLPMTINTTKVMNSGHFFNIYYSKIVLQHLIS